MDRPSHGVQHRRRGFVWGHEGGVHLLPHGDQAVGDGGSNEAGGESDGGEEGSLVDEGAEPVEDAVGAGFEHMAWRTGGKDGREGGGGDGGCRRGRGQEVHEDKVHDRSNDECGEDEIKLVEAEIRPGRHVTDNAGGDSHRLIH